MNFTNGELHDYLVCPRYYFYRHVKLYSLGNIKPNEHYYNCLRYVIESILLPALANKILDPPKLEVAWFTAWMEDPISLQYEVANQSKETYYRDGVKCLNSLIDFFQDKNIVQYNRSLSYGKGNHQYTTHLDVLLIDKDKTLIPCIFTNNRPSEIQAKLNYQISAIYQYMLLKDKEPITTFGIIPLQSKIELVPTTRSIRCLSDLNDMIFSLGDELDRFNNDDYNAYQRPGNWCSTCYYKDICKGPVYVNENT
jgi:hypothetical protein